MKASINPYMAAHTGYLDTLETAATRQRALPGRSGLGDWARSLAVIAVAFGLVAVTLPWMV